MKFYMFIIMAFMLIPIGYAYDSNTTIPIIAEYKESGVYESSDAYITIINPDNVIERNNISMTEIYTGGFTYNYTCNESGTYTTSVSFRNKTDDSVLGSDTDTFVCGNPNAFNLGMCPESDMGMIGLWVFMVIMLIVAIAGIGLNYAIMTAISGIVYIFMAVIFWNCSDIVAYISVILGLGFLMIGANQKRGY